MTYKIVKLERAHLDALRKEEINGNLDWLDEGMMNHLLNQPFSGSVFYNGTLLLSGGVMPYWFNRAQIWTLFSEKAKSNFLPAFRGIKKYLEYQPYKRVEMSVPVDVEIGKKRAIALGFKLECECAKSFLPDGKDATLFSYVKDN